MVLKTLLLLLIPALCLGDSSYMDLKKDIEVLEREGTSSLTQATVATFKEPLSPAAAQAPQDFDEVEDRFDQVIDNWLKKRISGRWNIFVSLTSWTYGIDLPISKQTLFSDELGACGGGGYDWENHWFGFGIDLSLGGMSGKSSINLPANFVVYLDLPVFVTTSRPKV